MLKIEDVNVSQLKPWERNPRVNDHAVMAVSQSIQTFGFNVPILCDQDLSIIAGHTRWKAAQTLGMATIPVICLTMTENQRKAFAVADNKTAEIADWDFPKLREVLEELQSEDLNLSDLGFSEEELRRFLGVEEQGAESIPSPPEVSAAKTGDLWELGSHRLLCGDSTNEASVAQLVGAEQIACIYGGPPYFNQREYAQWPTYEGYLVDMRRVITICHQIVIDGGVIVWNVANDCSAHKDLAGHHSRLLEESGFQYVDNYRLDQNEGKLCHP